MVKKRNKNKKLSKKNEKKYINIMDFMQKEYPLTFILGARSVGKTISAFTTLIKHFKETGERGVYIRRYDTEIETSAINLSLLGQLTGSEINRGKVKVNGVATDMIMVDGEPAIYMLALSVASKYKSNSFDNVWLVIYDEFIDLDNRELRSETKKFMQFMMTVFREYDKLRATFLANATNIFNCYFLDFEVMPESRVTKYKELGIKIIMYQTSEELKQEQINTVMSKLVSKLEGDEGSSLENKFTANFDNFISKLSKNAKYIGTYKLNDELYGCYKEKDYYLISRKYDEGFKRKNALSYEDVDEDFELINWDAYSTLRGWFMKRRVRFTDVKTRTAFIRRFKKMSLYSD